MMAAISHFELTAILLTLTAAFSWVNYRLELMPRTIRILVMGLGASLVVIGAEAALPGLVDYEGLAVLVRQVDFEETVLHGMLAFLLFADALHVGIASLRRRALTIGATATVRSFCLPSSCRACVCGQ